MHSWDDFRYFLSVVNTGSYSAAARKLNVNHSTVSRRIQALEKSHGVRLLERTQTGYQMTEAGVSIYEITQEINQANVKASRILLGQDARLEGEINLTMPHEIYDHFLAKPLSNFQKSNPDIYFNLQVSKGLRNIANREADLAVRITANPPEELIGTRVSYLKHGFYKHRDLYVDKTTPVIIWEKEKELPLWANEYFSNPKIVMRVDDLNSMYQAVKSGIGIARMPCFLPDIIADENVDRMPIDLPLSNWGVWLLSHVDLRNTARINACRSHLKQSLSDFIPYFEGKMQLDNLILP